MNGEVEAKFQSLSYYCSHNLDFHQNCSKATNVLVRIFMNKSPITAMGCRQCLPFGVVRLKGKHCRKPHGVVNTFRQYISLGIQVAVVGTAF